MFVMITLINSSFNYNHCIIIEYLQKDKYITLTLYSFSGKLSVVKT